MNMSSPAVAHHLKLLRDADLVVTRREEKEVYYSVSKTEKAQMLHHMIESIQEIACPDENDIRDTTGQLFWSDGANLKKTLDL